jgi:hypothetical protein
MKYWIIVVLILFSGCEYGEDETNKHVNNYNDWASRESWGISSLNLTYSPDREINTVSVNAVADWSASKITYSNDSETHGRDYWQSANETLSLGSGDCEDVAILNYVILLNLGYREDQIDCFIVNLYENGQYKGCHTIIGFYVDGYVDNRIRNGPGVMITEDSQNVEYEIVYTFNKSGIYLWQG